MIVMSASSSPSVNAEDERRIWFALLLLTGLLVAVVGESISAAGAPEVGVVNAWGRIDEAVSRIADWPLLLVAILAALTVLGGFRLEPVAVGVRNARVAWIGVIAALGVLAVASVVGMVAVFERIADAGAIGGVGSVGYYSESEKIGESVAYAAILLVAIGVGVRVVQSLRSSLTTSES